MFQAFSVPAETPDLPLTTIKALPQTDAPSSCSPIKSGVPGVSKRLIFTPFHSIGITDVLREIFLFISSGSKSDTVFPSSVLPARSIVKHSFYQRCLTCVGMREHTHISDVFGVCHNLSSLIYKPCGALLPLSVM